MLQTINIIFNDLNLHIPYLLILVLLWAVAYLFTYLAVLRLIFPTVTPNKREFIRSYLLIVALLSLASVVYWSIDVHIVNLPDPITLYTLTILVVTARFGLTVGVVTALLSLFLNIAAVINLYGKEFQAHTLPEHLLLIAAILSSFISIIVGNWIHNLNKSKSELELLVKARDELESITAHELKTPVTVIKLYAQLIAKKHQKEAIESTLIKSLDTITKETDKLSYMIDNLMDFSKFKQNKYTPQLKKIDIVGECKNKVHIMQSLYPSHIIQVSTGVTTAFVNIDSFALDRILTNLITNAVKYSPQKSIIKLTIRDEANQLVIVVKDHGDGIERELLDNIFEPFYQVNNEKKGLGLGLYITKSLVEANHGSISVSSAVGEGTTFSMVFKKSNGDYDNSTKTTKQRRRHYE